MAWLITRQSRLFRFLSFTGRVSLSIANDFLNRLEGPGQQGGMAGIHEVKAPTELDVCPDDSSASTVGQRPFPGAVGSMFPEIDTVTKPVVFILTSRPGGDRPSARDQFVGERLGATVVAVNRPGEIIQT